MGIIAASPEGRGVERYDLRRPSGGGGLTSWSVPPIPGFNRGIYKKFTPKQFRSLMGMAVIAGRRGLPGLGWLGDPNQPSTWGTPGPGCSPVGDGTCHTALYGNVPCNEVRECDTMTGALHFEYMLPTGSPSNVNITEVSPDSGRVIGYSDISYKVQATGPIKVGTQVVNPKTGVQVYTPPGPTGGGAKTTTPPPAGSGSGASGSGGGGAGAGAAAATVVLQNTSRPGQPLQVGDNWSLAITGPPNASVINTAAHNGTSIGSTNYGKTDSNGKFALNGYMSPDTVGTWYETWSVGNSSASLSFSVANASGSGSNGASAGTGETGGGGATSTDPGTIAAPPATSSVVPFSFMGLSGTSLLIVAGLVIAGAWLLFGRKR